MYRVTRNLIIDEWRRATRENAVGRRFVEPDVFRADSTELLDVVRRLPPVHRDVLLLHYWSDLSVARIAQVLKCPEGTIKRRLHDARSKLGHTLEQS